jgi:hypothetical protein
MNMRAPGRPPADTSPVLVRLHREQLERIDVWRAKQRGKCSRPEALRRLVDIGAHCEPYVARLLKHLEQVAEHDYREVKDTIEALRSALGEADSVLSPTR